MSDNLKVKTARGSMFTGAVIVGLRPLSLVIDVLLLRLLNPEDFGLIALAMILFNTANLFTDFGMRQAIVQTRDDLKKVAHYAFVMVMAGSILVNGLVIALAQPLAQLLGGTDALVPIITWLSLLITIDGLWVVPDGLLRRDLRFKHLALSQFVAEFGGGVLTVVMAFMGFGVWSFVVGQLGGKLLKSAFLYVYCRPWFWLRPQRWERPIVERLVRYGAPTTGAGLLKYFASQWDTWYVGRTLGLRQVGYYSKAFDITTRLGDMLANALFGQVLFPSYARLQNEPERLRRAYLKSTSLVFMFIVPMALGLLVTAPILVPVLLGAKWAPMIPAWQIFCLYGMTRPISTNASPLFLAVGKPRNNMTAALLLIAVMVPGVLVLSARYGIVGAAIGVWAAHVVAMLFNVYQVERILPQTALKTLTNALPFLFAGGVMSLAVILLQEPIIRLSGGENVTAVSALIAIGALVYLALILLLQRPLVVELYELFIKALGLDRRWPRLAPRRPRPTE